MEIGNLKPKDYIPRICDSLLSKALETFSAVEVSGPMWCGKTWTSLAFGNSVTRLGREAIRRLVEADPTAALIGDQPHVVDEWQDVPAVWDATRDAVDESGNRPGQYILTGSSSLRKDAVSHSGAGRIAKLRMNTMSLLETGDSSGSISLAALFEGRFEPQLVHTSLADISEMICRGGWPALQDRPEEDASLYLDSYLDAVFDVSFPKRGLDGDIARSVGISLARNMGGATKLETIAQDVFGAAGEYNKQRVSEYVSAFESLYLVDAVKGWDAPVRSKSRIRTKPKRYFSDVSLAVGLLQLNASRLLEDGQLFGVLFESLCMHDLTVYASALPQASQRQPLRYYRDSDGLEVDAILELRDGRWAAFEIKLGEAKAAEGAKALNRLKAKVAANPAARNPEPSFLAVLIGASEFARFDKENGVYVIPITSLGV